MDENDYQNSKVLHSILIKHNLIKHFYDLLLPHVHLTHLLPPTQFLPPLLAPAIQYPFSRVKTISSRHSTGVGICQNWTE